MLKVKNTDIDEHLSWKPHISQVARKISKSIGAINRARFFLPKPCLKTLYYSLVYPYLHYCIIVWGSTYKTNLRRLISLQKRVIRRELFLNQLSILIQTLFSKN